MTVGELASYYRQGNMVLTRMLDRMVECDLVKREADIKDRRVVRVFLAEKGKELSHLLDFYKDINKTLLEGFTEQEKTILFELLERVISNSHEALGIEPRKTD